MRSSRSWMRVANKLCSVAQKLRQPVPLAVRRYCDLPTVSHRGHASTLALLRRSSPPNRSLSDLQFFTIISARSFLVHPLAAPIQPTHSRRRPTSSYSTLTTFSQSPEYEGVAAIRREHFSGLERRRLGQGIKPRFAHPRNAPTYATSSTFKRQGHRLPFRRYG